MDAGARLRKPRELMMADGSKERETLSCEPGGEERIEDKKRHTRP